MTNKPAVKRPANVVHIAYLEGDDISVLSTVYRTSQMAKREAETQAAEQGFEPSDIRWGDPVQDDETGLYSWCGETDDDAEVCWVAEVEVR